MTSNRFQKIRFQVSALKKVDKRIFFFFLFSYRHKSFFLKRCSRWIRGEYQRPFQEKFSQGIFKLKNAIIRFEWKWQIITVTTHNFLPSQCQVASVWLLANFFLPFSSIWYWLGIRRPEKKSLIQGSANETNDFHFLIKLGGGGVGGGGGQYNFFLIFKNFSFHSSFFFFF